VAALTEHIAESDAQRNAAKRYPFLWQRNRIRGRGPFGMVSKCDGVPFIKLYNTELEREYAAKRSCGSRKCTFYHLEEDFRS
jgi:hypothetical protein